MTTDIVSKARAFISDASAPHDCEPALFCNQCSLIADAPTLISDLCAEIERLLIWSSDYAHQCNVRAGIAELEHARANKIINEQTDTIDDLRNELEAAEYSADHDNVRAVKAERLYNELRAQFELKDNFVKDFERHNKSLISERDELKTRVDKLEAENSYMNNRNILADGVCDVARTEIERLRDVVHSAFGMPADMICDRTMTNILTQIEAALTAASPGPVESEAIAADCADAHYEIIGPVRRSNGEKARTIVCEATSEAEASLLVLLRNSAHELLRLAHKGLEYDELKRLRSAVRVSWTPAQDR